MSIKVNGKDAKVAGFEALKGAKDPVELVILIDGSARTSLGRQLSDIEEFVNKLPPNIRATIGYMQNGNTALTGPLTADHAAVLKGLHIPGGAPGSNASPYFCISDLAKRWPSQDRSARREVVMVTDGVDEYNRRYDPDDPYLQAAIQDSVKAHMVVYAIYWRDSGRFDQTGYANNTGQNLILQVTDATGVTRSRPTSPTHRVSPKHHVSPKHRASRTHHADRARHASRTQRASQVRHVGRNRHVSRTQHADRARRVSRGRCASRRRRAG